MDFLLGVHDLARSGALRFRSAPGGPYLDDSKELVAPPVTSLRELAHVSQKLEEPALALDEASAEPRIDTVLDTAEYYRLSAAQAQRVLSQVRAVVRGWRVKAQSVGFPRAELQRMESAFAT